MNIRVLAIGFACATGLFGQHHRFSWQDACFNNPRLPYCNGHESAVKPTKGGARSAGTSSGTSSALDPTVDAGGVDWRFADPSADALAVLHGSKASASPAGHNLIDQLGTTEGLSQADIQNVFRGLSSVNQVALSVRQNRIVLLVTGRAADTILPAPEAGWKAESLGGDALLIGHSDAVDQAFQRLLTSSPLSELASKALERQADSEFWMVAPAQMAGPQAVAAGVKLFSMTASMRSDLTSDTTYEFSGAPEAGKIQAWLGTLVDPKVEGNAVHVRSSMGADETRKSFGQITATAFGRQLGTLIKSARYLPVRDTATTVHTKPVIYGLDDGAREVKYR